MTVNDSAVLQENFTQPSSTARPPRPLNDQLDEVGEPQTEGVTYRELGEEVGKSAKQVKYAVGRVSDILPKVNLHVGETGKSGVENRLTPEGASLVVEYLSDSAAFKARYQTALATQTPSTPLTQLESQDATEAKEDQRHREAEILEYKEVFGEALDEVSAARSRKNLKEEMVRKLELDDRKKQADSRLNAALARYQKIQNGNIEAVESLRESNRELQSSVEGAMGKLGISISLPWN